MNAVVNPAEQAQLAEAAPPQAPRGGLSVVQYAVQSGAPIQQVQALLELQVRADTHQLEMMREKRRMDQEDRQIAARSAYYEAMAKFKAKGVRVIRDKDITDGPLKGKKHATVGSVADAANAALSEFGLSASWRPVSEEKDWIKLSCVITHVDGYSEEASFSGGIDTGPGRNAIQARKSTLSYLERITMELVLGLAEHDDDDDGRGAGGAGAGAAGSGKEDEAAAAFLALVDAGNAEAEKGMKPLTAWWGKLNSRQQKDLSAEFGAMRKVARQADERGAK